MKKLFKSILFFAALSVALSSFTACEKTATTQKGPVDENEPEIAKKDSKSDEDKKNTAKYPPLPEGIATAEVEDLDGGTFKISDKKGKVLVLNLWATWCVPCIAEMPHLIEMQNEHKDQNFEVIGLNVGDGDGVPEPKEKIEAFVKKHNLNYELARADRKLFSEFVTLTRMPVVPQTVIVNREGRMTGIFTGGSKENFAKMKEVVEKTIKE